jgi:hypothetical protein
VPHGVFLLFKSLEHVGSNADTTARRHAYDSVIKQSWARISLQSYRIRLRKVRHCAFAKNNSASVFLIIILAFNSGIKFPQLNFALLIAIAARQPPGDLGRGCGCVR